MVRLYCVFFNININNLISSQEFEFSKNFKEVLKSAEEWGRAQACIPKQMRTFNESTKSKKTVASMIERKGDDKENKKNSKLNLFTIYIIERKQLLNQENNKYLNY